MQQIRLEEKRIRLCFFGVWVICVCMDIHYSLTPTIPIPLTFDNSDKILHFLTYGLLAALPGLFCVSIRRFVLFVLFVIMLGTALEIRQYFVVGRDFSFLDMSANNLGALVSLVIIGHLKKDVGE